jgi:uncharacterized membrane protein
MPKIKYTFAKHAFSFARQHKRLLLVVTKSQFEISGLQNAVQCCSWFLPII